MRSKESAGSHIRLVRSWSSYLRYLGLQFKIIDAFLLTKTDPLNVEVLQE